MKSEFLTHLQVDYLDDENFFLLSVLRYQSAILGGIIEAEIRFVSDGSSVPRVPIIYELYGNRAHHESVIHDRLYRAIGHMIRVTFPDGSSQFVYVTKAMADSVFKEAMIVRGKKPYIVEGMYLGVKFGGRSSYESGPSRFKILDS